MKKTVDNVITESFFNENWQELESVSGGVTTTYVWGLRYVDDMVLRERGQEKLFALQDANWNVVAVADSSGAVQERYVYDGFGKRTTLMDSGIDFDRAFTGQVFDAETGLMLYRNRYYSTELGRFVSRDPIGYEAGDVNLVRYVGNNSETAVDAYGLQATIINGNIFQCMAGGGTPSECAMYPPYSNLPPAPDPAPTPTGEGCPAGWKMIQKSPPVPNGCGPAGGGIKAALAGVGVTLGHWAGDIDFTPSCNGHDTCWGTCSSDRKKCDDKFLKDMKDQCNKKFPGKQNYLQRQWCFLAARRFYSAVSGGGGDGPFDNARGNHCECVCDK